MKMMAAVQNEESWVLKLKQRIRLIEEGIFLYIYIPIYIPIFMPSNNTVT